MSELKLPMTCGDVTLIAVGKLEPAAPGSHDEDYVYPIGFHTSRKHASATNPSSKCIYHSEIVADSNGRPVFKVTCSDMSEHPYEDSTPNGAWSLVFEAIASCTRRSSRSSGPHVSDRKGWDLFGLNSDKIKKILMDLEGVEKCTKLRYNKERAAREAKEKQKQEEEEERELREEREREKRRKEKFAKSKKKNGEYQQPPMLEELHKGEWRCLEDDMEIVAGGSEEQVAVNNTIPEGEGRQREQLHRIWELAAVQQFLRSFKSVLGVSPLTTEDFHTAFLECSSALKVIHLRLLMPAGERKRAPEMAEGDGWLDILRDRLREEREEFDEDSQETVKQLPIWSQFLDKDPMPESIHQYFELTLRERALILWYLCESLLDGEEELRDVNIGRLDWDASADALRLEPNASDKDGNSYWYFEGGSGVLYKEGPPKSGRKSKAPVWEPISRSHQDLADAGVKLQQEGKKRKLSQLQEFGSWIVDSEAPRLQSKEQAKERAKSKAALLEMLPRKRSERVATKEDREREEAEKQRQREEELARRKEQEEKRKKERERQQQEKLRQLELEKLQKEEERARQFKEAERERRLRKRRRLLAKQAQAQAQGLALAQTPSDQARVDGAMSVAIEDDEDEGEWWEIGNHVEVFCDDDWWQAVILKNKAGQTADEMQIYVGYIGGSEDDNEWLPITSTRVRPPTDSFWDQDGVEGEDSDDEPMPQAAPEHKAFVGTSVDSVKTQEMPEPASAVNGSASTASSSTDRQGLSQPESGSLSALQPTQQNAPVVKQDTAEGRHADTKPVLASDKSSIPTIPSLSVQGVAGHQVLPSMKLNQQQPQHNQPEIVGMSLSSMIEPQLMTNSGAQMAFTQPGILHMQSLVHPAFRQGSRAPDDVAKGETNTIAGAVLPAPVMKTDTGGASALGSLSKLLHADGPVSGHHEQAPSGGNGLIPGGNDGVVSLSNSLANGSQL